MINKNIISLYLNHYKLSDATSKIISDGLNGGVFLIKHKNKKYVLKIQNKSSNIETEIQFNKYLNDKKIPTAKIIKNIEGELVTTIDETCGSLFKFCTGEQISWNNLGIAFSKNLAKTVAKMHLLTANNTQIKAKNYNKCRIDSLVGLSNINIINKCKEINNSIEGLILSNFRQGLIHSDLTRQNILVTKNKKNIQAIIDFGDTHYDYIIWDLAVLITHIFITKTYGIDWVALSAFIKKYYSIFLPTEQEIEAIIPFMKIRNINLAIEVNRLTKNKKGNLKKLLSIENSVMTKIDIINKNQIRLLKLLKHHAT
jgi:Ser/Thr protein kinase RdoA (MazF antagonist)